VTNLAQDIATTRLCFRTRYEVNDLWLAPEALGRLFVSFVDDDVSVGVRIPSAPEDLQFPSDDVVRVSACSISPTFTGTGASVSVRVVSVEAEFNGAVSTHRRRAAEGAKEAGDETALDRFADECDTAIRPFRKLVDDTFAKWIHRVRVEGKQPWLGSSAERPRQYGNSHLVDIENDGFLMGWGPKQSMKFRSGVNAMPLATLERISEASKLGTPLAADDTLIADARFLIHEAHDTDVQRGVLLAAIACEIRSKQSISDRAPKSKTAEAKGALSSCSSIHVLASKVSQQILGRSLEVDDPDLFDQIKNLTKIRNAIVHEAASPSEEQARELLAAVDSYVIWLDGL
jgi:hypothetical protein